MPTEASSTSSWTGATALPFPLRSVSASSAVSVPDLVGREHGAVDELGLVLREQPLQAEHQRPAAPPLDRRRVELGRHLGERLVDRAAARGPGGERGLGVLAVEDERLSRELRGAFDLVGRGKGRGQHGR
jgi:hypothetical protein